MAQEVYGALPIEPEPTTRHLMAQGRPLVLPVGERGVGLFFDENYRDDPHTSDKNRSLAIFCPANPTSWVATCRHRRMGRLTVKSPAQARETAQLTVEQAARQARICPAYLRRIERHGGATYVLAMRLARLYSCSANLFLYPSTEGQSRYPKLRMAA